jgi:nicotinamide N-methyltransferase
MSSDDEGGLDLFQEPADYFKPEKEATLATHKLLSCDWSVIIRCG